MISPQFIRGVCVLFCRGNRFGVNCGLLTTQQRKVCPTVKNFPDIYVDTQLLC